MGPPLSGREIWIQEPVTRGARLGALRQAYRGPPPPCPHQPALRLKQPPGPTRTALAFPSAFCLSYFGALSTFKDHHRVAAPAPGLARPSCGGQSPGDPPPPRTPGFLPSGPGGGEAVGLRGLVQTSSGEHALSALASESWAAGEVARPPPTRPSGAPGSSTVREMPGYRALPVFGPLSWVCGVFPWEQQRPTP